MLEYINLHEVHHWIMMLGWFILVMVVFYLFDDKKDDAQNILKNRLVEGAISIEEFDKLKKVL